MSNFLITTKNNTFWDRVEIIHPEYGKLNFISEFDLETMQGLECHPIKNELHPIDLTNCTIIIKPI